MQHTKTIDIPRILIAALRGGSGKTVVSIGVIANLINSGKTVAPFKKGPDYIDAGWLALAAGRPCHNLDSFLFSETLVKESFFKHSGDADIAIVEGNRGLYDGLDKSGSTSSAALSVLLHTPIVLNIDCTKSTRTIAALVMGCIAFDPKVHIGGVILNRVAGPRHENLLRDCIESYCGIPVVGAIPKLSGEDFPERHMGLIPTQEHPWARNSIISITRVVHDHVDIEAICRIAADFPKSPMQDNADSMGLGSNARIVSERTLGDQPSPQKLIQELHPVLKPENIRPRIGIVRDSAFQFYYPENIDALVKAGADLVYMSPLHNDDFPDIDGLYIGGGFPETHAEHLSLNALFRDSLKSRVEEGLPVYAECGGLMYLGESLVLDRKYPMAGILPVVFGFSRRPQGHGYTIARVTRENPYFPLGMELRGHEFHYSKVIEWKGCDADLVLDMDKGKGIIRRSTKASGGLADDRAGNYTGFTKDGLCVGNVFATYTHLHACGYPQWAHSLVRLARHYKVHRSVHTTLL